MPRARHSVLTARVTIPRVERTRDTARDAWCALAGLPVEFLRFGHGLPVVLSIVPISIFITIELDAPFRRFVAVAAGTGDVLAYGTRAASPKARVPVVGSDETDRLAGSFNRMVAGLEERERLREAFGAAAQGLTSPAKMTGSSALSSS